MRAVNINAALKHTKRGSSNMEFEQIKTQLYRTGNLSVSMMIMPNRKQANTNKLLKGAYVNTYNSSKYSDRRSLSRLNIVYNTYMEFEYTEYPQDGGKPISNNVLVSYPHLGGLQNFLNEIMDLLIENQEAIYNPNGINPEFANGINSPEFVSGAQLGFAPAKIPVTYANANQAVMHNGLTLFIGENQFAADMTLDAFNGLYNVLIGFTDAVAFNHDAKLTYIMAHLEHLDQAMGGNSPVAASTSGNGGFQPGSSAQTSTTRKSTPLGGGRTGTASGIRRKDTSSLSSGRGLTPQVDEPPITSPSQGKFSGINKSRTVGIENLDSLDDIDTMDDPFESVSTTATDLPFDVKTSNPLAASILDGAMDEDFDIDDDMI